MTTKSPCRSPNRRLHNLSSHPPQTRRLRHNTNLPHPRPINKTYSLPIHPTFIMRHTHNQLNLSPPSRPQITNRLLISKPHSPSHCIHPNPNPMKFYGSYNINNRSWFNLLTPILLGQHQLRTNPQSNHNHSSRPTNNLSINSNMMTYSKPSQPSSPTIN